MADINLLPTDIAPKGPVNKIAGILKNVAIVGVIVLILVIAGMGGYIFYLQSQVRNSIQTQEQLKESIRSLEQTEQRLVLLKDRLNKSNTVLAEDTAVTELENFEVLSANIPLSVRLTDAEISKESTELNYLAGTSSDLAQMMASIVTIEEYDSVQLTNLGFSPTSGYLVSLELR